MARSIRGFTGRRGRAGSSNYDRTPRSAPPPCKSFFYGYLRVMAPSLLILRSMLRSSAARGHRDAVLVDALELERDGLVFRGHEHPRARLRHRVGPAHLDVVDVEVPVPAFAVPCAHAVDRDALGDAAGERLLDAVAAARAGAAVLEPRPGQLVLDAPARIGRGPRDRRLAADRDAGRCSARPSGDARSRRSPCCARPGSRGAPRSGGRGRYSCPAARRTRS